MPDNFRKHGYKGQVMVAGVAVASVSKWALSMPADRAKVTAFGDAHHKYVQGLRDIKGTISGFIDLDASSPAEGNAPFLDACESSTPVVLKLVPDSDTATDFWTGSAVLDVSVEVSVEGAVSFSGTFAAAGNTDWSREGN
jgi:hypothetical protein